MIVVTGGAGFIGSNLVKELNQQNYKNIIVVDNLTNGHKCVNLTDLDIADFYDKDEFLSLLQQGEFNKKIEVIFHQGACSKTTEWDGKYMMQNNFSYSKILLDFSLKNNIPFVYASSAATYGTREENFIEEREFEKPINVYGYSKFLFDQYVRKVLKVSRALVCGFKYFNVYGPREQHKDSMASVIFHFNNQVNSGKNLQLFEGSENFKRDFIFVEDVVKANVWAWRNQVSGIFNLGTGVANSFQYLAELVVDFHQKGKIDQIPFPEHLKNHYQKFTQANLTKLRKAGFNEEFTSIESGVKKYLQLLNKK